MPPKTHKNKKVSTATVKRRPAKGGQPSAIQMLIEQFKDKSPEIQEKLQQSLVDKLKANKILDPIDNESNNEYLIRLRNDVTTKNLQEQKTQVTGIIVEVLNAEVRKFAGEIVDKTKNTASRFIEAAKGALPGSVANLASGLAEKAKALSGKFTSEQSSMHNEGKDAAAPSQLAYMAQVATSKVAANPLGQTTGPGTESTGKPSIVAQGKNALVSMLSNPNFKLPMLK